MIRASSDVATKYRRPSLGCAGLRLGWAVISGGQFGNYRRKSQMDRNKEVAGMSSPLRLATRAVGSAALLAMGLFAVPAWAQCAFSAPTERANTGADGWDDGATATSGDLIFIVGAGTTGITMPAVADEAACAGEGAVQVTLWKDGVQQETADGETDIVLLVLTDDATTPSEINVSTTAADTDTLAATGAAVNYTAAGTDPGFHNAAPVSFELRASKAFGGNDVATFSFTVTLRPAALGTAPATVELYSETATSIYVEWTGDGNPSDATADPVVADTTAEAYEIEYTYTPSGTMAMPVTRTMLVTDTATGTTTAGTGVNPRQSATLTHLAAGAEYTITVKGVRGMGYARQESAATTTDSGGTDLLTETTRSPYFNPRLETDNEMAMPYKISVGESVDLQVKDLIYIGVAGASSGIGEEGEAVPAIDPADNPALTSNQGRGTLAADAGAADDPIPSFNFMVSGGSSSSFSVEYLNDGDSNNADDLIRINGLGKAAARTVTLTATSMDGMTTLTGTMQVQVLENFAPMFAISEATVDWNVKDADDALTFEIDVMANFVTDQIADANSGDCGGNDNSSNEINCDHTLEFSMSGGSGFFEIDDETGVISVRGPTGTQTAEQYLERVKEGDQYEITVTATDQNDAEDEMTIFVDVVGEDNDAPKRRSTARDLYLQPLTESNGGGYRVARGLRSQFSDEEGDDLCFEIRSSDLDDSDMNTLAEAELGGASSCQNDTLTISMNLPSTDPEDDNFGLLGKYGTETVSVTVGAYERGSSPRVSTAGAVTVSVKLVYGQNEGPSIRSVAQVTGRSTYVTSGTHEIDEGADIRLTFTADDAQPTGDALCWRVGFGSCGPCTGSPDEDRTRTSTGATIHRRSSNRVSSSGVSHEYDLIIAGEVRQPAWQGGNVTTVTDYERYNGVYTVRLCAADLAGETHRITFDVKLKDVEEAPELDDIDALYMVVGDDPTEVDLSDYASDGDGDADIASYDANCIVSCRGAVTISEDDGTLTITPRTTEIGEADENDTLMVEIEASVTDSTGMTAYTTIDVTVKDRNSSPMFDGGLAAVSYSMPENSRSYRIGEPLAISDSDDEGNTLSVSTSSRMFSASRVVTSPTGADPEDVTYGVQIRSGSGPFDFEDEDGINSYDISVTVMDRYGGRDTIEVRVDLTDVNEKPVIVEDSGDIDDQKILVGVTRCVVDASMHFEDPDHRDQQAGLYIEASTTRPSDARVEVVDNNMICVTGLNVGSGAGRVKVTATDREDLQVSKTFRLTVEANMMPTVVDEGIPDTMVDEGGRTPDIDMNMYFDDGDMLYEEDLSFDFSIDNPGVATGALVGEDLLRIYGDAKGTAMVTVTATDEDNQSVSDTFEIEVTKNDPPVPNPDAIDDVVTRIGLVEDPIDARDAFTDEGDQLTYSVETGDPDVATAAMKYDEEGGPWIVIHSHSPGNTDCTLTARDSADNKAEVEFSIEVGARNDAPTVANAIDDVTLEEGDRHDIDLEDVFEDEAALDIEVENEDESVADVVHRRSANEIRVYANMAGTTTVTVTATDNVGQTATDEFEVTVEAVPEAVGAIADQTLQIGGEDLDLNVSEYFSYTDGVDLLSYTVTTDGSAAASITNIGSLLTMSPFTRGSTEVTVTATDPRGKTAVQTFSTIVSDSELRAVAENALAGYGRAILAGISQAIGSRLESNRSESGLGMGQFARFAPTSDVSYTAGTEFSANQGVMGFGHVGNQTSQTSMGAAPDFSNFNLKSVVSSSFSKNLNGKGGVGTWSLWSTRDSRNFSGEGYEGNTDTTFMGLDILANKNWLVGVTASRNAGTSQYSWGTASQTMNTELLSVMPYFNFEPSSKTSLWGVVGYGTGDITSTVVNASSQSSDLSMNLGMLGGRQALAQAGILQLAVRGDASFANLASADGSGAVDDLSANVHRVRAGLEGSLTFAIGNGSSIKPFGEVAYRSDGGDGLTGSGFEVGGGVRVETNAFTIEARGHKTASHSAEDFSESGFSIHAEIAQSADGSGFALTATPRWTQSTGIRTADSVVWNDASTFGQNGLRSMQQYGHADGNPAFNSRAGMAFDTALKYGFRINNDRYLVTPFVEAQSYADSVTSLIGFEFKQLMKASRIVDMRFVVGRNDDSYGSQSQVGVNARILF